jgi:hypothetical protein
MKVKVRSKRLPFSNACLVLLLTTAFGQRSGHSQNSSLSNFLLDETKPYVYLEFDHVGPREPSRADEPHTGLWLRLHNNCIVPIIVNTFGTPPSSDPREMRVLDNVVRNPDPAWGDGAVTGMVLPQPSGETLAAILGGSGPVPISKEPAPLAPRQNFEEHMPNGYMFPVSSFVTIGPGQAVYLSVPLNHVGKTWHLEIPFRFAVKREGHVRWPNSFIAFYWEDLPKQYRAAVAPD